MATEKLNVIDRSFLRLESPRHPFHVAGLMILRKPEGASRNWLRRLAAACGELNRMWPLLDRKLADPDDLRHGAWVPERDYRPEHHVLHYALPQPGRMAELLELVSRAHERQLDRSRPLWELHLIEGLPRDRFALYCKVHHALIDGAAGMKMIDALFSTSPTRRLRAPDVEPVIAHRAARHDLLEELGAAARGLVEQSRALPQLSTLLTHMGLDALRGAGEGMRLPFSAPRSLFNTETDPARRVILCDLPFATVRGLARRAGGSINDVLLAVCGGALRRYLMEQGALPRRSLVAGLPVAIRRGGGPGGNQLSFILCPFFTDESDDQRRLQRVIRTTSRAKAELAAMSPTAGQDFSNLLLMPTVLLTLTGNATRVPPVVNAIFSNVPGSRRKLYLDGAELESLYPLSVITDGMCLNITVVSYTRKLCFAITACPTRQPGIERFDRFLRQSYDALRDSL